MKKIKLSECDVNGTIKYDKDGLEFEIEIDDVGSCYSMQGAIDAYIKGDIEEHNDDGTYLDEDGYPTDLALNKIKYWDFTDVKGCFEFIKSIWHYPEWGFEEENSIDSFTKDPIIRYNISTGGWSGNESIMYMLEKNTMVHYLSWKESRVGGHYVFEIDPNRFED